MVRVRVALGVALVTVAGFTRLETAALAMSPRRRSRAVFASASSQQLDLPCMTPKILEATEGLRSLPGMAVTWREWPSVCCSLGPPDPESHPEPF